MNDGNLVPNSERSPEKVRENAQKGGIASGKARAEKKLLREALRELLDTEFEDKKAGDTKQGVDVLAVALFKRAAQGNVKAFETIRDTVGEKPVDRYSMIGEQQKGLALEELERMVLGDGADNV